MHVARRASAWAVLVTAFVPVTAAAAGPDPAGGPWSGTLTMTDEWSTTDPVSSPTQVITSQPQMPDRYIGIPMWSCTGRDTHRIVTTGSGAATPPSYSVPYAAYYSGEESCTAEYSWAAANDPTTLHPCSASASWSASYADVLPPQGDALHVAYSDTAGGAWSANALTTAPHPVTFTLTDSCGMITGTPHAPYIVGDMPWDADSGFTPDTVVPGSRIVGSWSGPISVDGRGNVISTWTSTWYSSTPDRHPRSRARTGSTTTATD